MNGEVLASAVEPSASQRVSWVLGAIAAYIPELSKAGPNRFGLSLASLEGHLYHAGHTSAPFSIQSVSKPFVYALALHISLLALQTSDPILARVPHDAGPLIYNIMRFISVRSL